MTGSARNRVLTLVLDSLAVW